MKDEKIIELLERRDESALRAADSKRNPEIERHSISKPEK